MPAGKYYIGDLCYVMYDEWDEFCEITIDGRTCNDGEFTLKDGRRFATYGTAYGDGTYEHNQPIGAGLGVDAGLIGCILVSDIDQACGSNHIKDGIVVEFDQPFETHEENGTIHFGNVKVFTAYEEPEDDYYDEES
jgi:hypothetical protein